MGMAMRELLSRQAGAMNRPRPGAGGVVSMPAPMDPGVPQTLPGVKGSDGAGPGPKLDAPGPGTPVTPQAQPRPYRPYRPPGTGVGYSPSGGGGRSAAYDPVYQKPQGGSGGAQPGISINVNPTPAPGGPHTSMPDPGGLRTATGGGFEPTMNPILNPSPGVTLGGSPYGNVATPTLGPHDALLRAILSVLGR